MNHTYVKKTPLPLIKRPRCVVPGPQITQGTFVGEEVTGQDSRLLFLLLVELFQLGEVVVEGAEADLDLVALVDLGEQG